ncbi:MAG: helix-turn-helix transcriptional regulator [Spirochaetes bacterium]|nr:helix-turn-helix transcriptional regulator [Spirochaetota bacterium]
MPPTRRSPFFSETLNHLHFSICHHGWVELGPEWHEEDTVSPYSRLYLVKSGGGLVRTQGRRVTLRPGRAYLFPLRVPLSFSTAGRLEKFFIHFNLRHLGFLDLFELLPPRVTERPLPPGLLAAVSRFDRGGLADVLRVQAELLRALHPFLGPATPATAARLELARQYQPLVEYIDAHLGPELSMGELAGVMGLSATWLSMRFHRDTGGTLKRFILERIRVRAERELSARGKKVREIARELGFRDELYFSKFFRRETGFYPLAWRDRYAGAVSRSVHALGE